MPSPPQGTLASRLIASMSSTSLCERQVEECHASEGKNQNRVGVIPSPIWYSVPRWGPDDRYPAVYCRLCGPDSCCADHPPAEPSLRVVCLMKPVCREVQPSRWSGFPLGSRLSRAHFSLRLSRPRMVPACGLSVAGSRRHHRLCPFLGPPTPRSGLQDIPQFHPTAGLVPRFPGGWKVPSCWISKPSALCVWLALVTRTLSAS